MKVKSESEVAQSSLVAQLVKNLRAMQELLLLSHFSRVRLCATPETAAHQAPTAAAAAKSLQSCLILCDPIGGSPTGSPIPGILQARTLEWVAISFSNA